MRFDLFFLAVTVLPLSTWAAEPADYSGMYQSCIVRYGGSGRAADGNCAVEVSNQAKLEITYLYKRLHAQLSSENPQLVPKLESSQKAWLKYRDEYCKLESSHTTADGSTVQCDMRLDTGRAKELRVFF